MSEQETQKTQKTQKTHEKKAPGLLSIIQSVLAAMVGIQSKSKHEQDFQGGHIGNYIFVGIVLVIIFIFTLISIVNSILENAGQ